MSEASEKTSKTRTRNTPYEGLQQSWQEHCLWSSGDRSQTAVTWGMNGKRGGRGSRCRLSKGKGDMGEYLEEDMGLKKALRVLWFKLLNIFVSWRARASTEGGAKDIGDGTLCGLGSQRSQREWWNWVEVRGLDSPWRDAVSTTGGKEMRTDADVGVLSLQVMDKEVEEFLARWPVFSHWNRKESQSSAKNQA